jgi:D-serine dehydratase
MKEMTVDFTQTTAADDLVLDSGIRGVPPGVVTRQSNIGSRMWSPLNGSMTLPVLTLDEPALAANTAAFLGFARDRGVLVAPHAKTPMMPKLAASLVADGAWGATVANVQQLGVLLAEGVKRLIYGSPPGGTAGCRHLAAMLDLYPTAHVYVFLDSVEGVKALDAALRESGATAHGLVELGFGRTGARDLRAAEAIVAAILETNGTIALSGVATYEAAAITPGVDAKETLDTLFDLVSKTYRAVREAAPDRHLTLTAGGSIYFDAVIDSLGPLVQSGSGSLVLRSGAIFFSDDGLYKHAFQAMADRGRTMDVARAIRPVLSLWAEILSVPEPGLAIAGFGMRDAPNDQGLPVVRQVFRDGVPIDPASVAVDRLNDQHAFIRGAGTNGLRIGDIIELGISHPCTALQRWRIVFGCDENRIVHHAFETRFG